MSEKVSLEKIVSLSKQRGFIFPGSEIYGGLANSWDYGPLGVLLKNNIRDAWWKYFVKQRRNMVGLDAAIMMNSKVWEVSGHVGSFSDPMVECKSCHKRFRLDDGSIMPEEEYERLLKLSSKESFPDLDGDCPSCGVGMKSNFTTPKKFNLMFETDLGSTEESGNSVYLRPELAQSMFVDFKRVVESMRLSVPFGIAQVGKVFRNEITPGNFTYRTLEFDLMEFEYFVKEKEWKKTFDYWLKEMQEWLTKVVGINKKKLRVREHTKEELSHYSKRTVDIEYETPFGWKELFGLAYRTDFDLKSDAEASGEDLRVIDKESGEKFYPHVIEPTFGLTRLMLMIMLDSYHEEEVRGEKRVVMKFPKNLAPYQVAVLPLSRKEELMKVAEPIVETLSLFPKVLRYP